MIKLDKGNSDYETFMRRLNTEYSSDIPSRLKKLMEEVGELVEACMVRQSAKDDIYEKSLHVFEELGDVALILTHICSIYGVDVPSVVQTAKNKFDYRMAEKAKKEAE